MVIKSIDNESQVDGPRHCVFDLHEFLKAKRGTLKCAIRTKPKSYENNNIKHHTERRIIKESHGSSWVRDRLLGKGASSLVFLAKNKSPPNSDSNLPSEFAVKSYFMEDYSPLQHEKHVLRDIGPCAQVVRCYGEEITTTKSGREVYNILLEYCSESSLHDRILKFGSYGLPESEVRRYTRDIVQGLCYIHCYAGYIHCDLKPRNILLVPDAHASDGNSLMAKIADFGLAKKITPEVLGRDFRGTEPYMSPELAREGYLDWPADIWALGCVVREMFTGEPAWKGLIDGDNDQLPKIPDKISSMGRDFLERCFQISPYERTPAWLLIQHPFVSLYKNQFAGRRP